MFCPKCGKEVSDNSTFCSQCGYKISNDNASSNKVGRYENQGIDMGITVFMILSIFLCALMCTVMLTMFSQFFEIFFPGITVASGLDVLFRIIPVIPLIWIIPMTIYFVIKSKSQQRIEIGYKICVLLFVNLIAGIMLLCRKENDQEDN